MMRQSVAMLTFFLCCELFLTACSAVTPQLVSGGDFSIQGLGNTKQSTRKAERADKPSRGKKTTPSPTPFPIALPTVEPTAEPTPAPTPAPAEDLSVELAGWYNDGWDDESHAVYTQHAQLFSEVNPYWYNLGTSDSGPGASVDDGQVHERAYVYRPEKVEAVHQAQDLVIPTVGDNARGQINRILNTPTARTRLLDTLVDLVLRRGYDGIDLNMELGTPDGQAAYADFVHELATRLHVHHKRLSVTLKAAYNAQSESWEMFDYQRLGQTAVDRFKIMMYDHNFDAGMNVPGPIGEYPWIVRSLEYMIGRGLPAHKIQLGLHNYAWVWQAQPDGSFLMQFPHGTWSALASAVATISPQTPLEETLQWDSVAQESWRDYTVNGVAYRAYVGDVRTVQARLDLVKTYGLAGLTFWTLGREDARIYTALAHHDFGSSLVSSMSSSSASPNE